MSEKSILNKLQLYASSLGHRLFRNNSGAAWAGKAIQLANGDVLVKQARLVKYGIGTGSGDLIGGTVINITSDMVGRNILVFTNYEVKANRTPITKEQQAFHEAITKLGGISVIDRFKDTDIGENTYVESINQFRAASFGVK